MNDTKKSSWKPQAIAGALILIVIAVIVVKLIIWDKSGNVELEEVEAGAFDYESLDIVFNVDQAILDSHPSDDVNDILLIGNESAASAPAGSSIVDMISGIDNTRVTSLTYYYSQVADATNAFGNSEVSFWQSANLYDLVKALCTNDYSLQKTALDNGEVVDQAFYDKLVSTDLDKIDTLIIFYDSIDYRKASVLYDPNDKYNTSTYEGALRAAITSIQSAAPHIKIIVASPYLHGVVNDDGFEPATMINYGNGNLSEYVMREYNIAMECCVSYCDNFFGLITEDTMTKYCNDGTVYLLNGDGVKLIGNHMVEFIQRQY
ncbi:MAG: hypothetical protein K6A97_03740 [Lachnospiraceae bacterium]|nr:hypothetical protein [Lachnospiraceae bacterium]